MRIKVIILLLALFVVLSFFNSELSGAAGSSCTSDGCVEMAYFECVNGSLVNRSYVIGRCGVECTANGCNRLFWSFKCVNNVKVMSVKVPGDPGYAFGCNDSRTFQCWVDGSSRDRGLVVGRCGVECVNEGEESCDGKELIICEGNKKINKGKIDNKCGVVFLNIKADSDGDGSVSLNELTNYIQKWIEGDVSLNSLTNAIQEWING